MYIHNMSMICIYIHRYVYMYICTYIYLSADECIDLCILHRLAYLLRVYACQSGSLSDCMKDFIYVYIGAGLSMWGSRFAHRNSDVGLLRRGKKLPGWRISGKGQEFWLITAKYPKGPKCLFRGGGTFSKPS